MNDGLRTDIFLRYSPEIIACACIYLSARELQIPLPENPPWYTIFGADEVSITAICIRILHLYTHKKRSQDELERIVAECRETLERERLRAREASAAAASASNATSTTVTATNGATVLPEASAAIKPDQPPAEDPIKALLEKIKQNNAAKLADANKSASRSDLKSSNGHHHGSHPISRHSSFTSTGGYYDPADAPPGMIPPPHQRHHHHQGPPYPVVLPSGVHPYPANGADYYNYNEMIYASSKNSYYESGGMKRNKSASYMLESTKEIE
jgi:hypothetical protein